MRNALEKNESGAEFSIADVTDHTAFALEARRQLGRFNGGFLEGDLSVFRKVRARQNREREPYRIFEPAGQGKYAERPDSESERLKERFSRE